MQISQVKQLQDKTILTEPISGVLSEVYPAEKKTHPQYGDSTHQNAKLTQGADFIFVEFKDFPQDMAQCKGQQVTLASSQSAHGLNGVKVNRYFSQKHQKELVNLRITSSASVTVGQPTYNTEGQVQGGATPPQQAAPPSNPNPQRPQPPAQAKPLGVTVGSAVNNACDLLKGKVEPGTPEFSKALVELSSDILRVSLYLQEGNLAEHPRNRVKGANPAPSQPQTPPPPLYNPANPSPEDTLDVDVPMGFDDDDDAPPF